VARSLLGAIAIAAILAAGGSARADSEGGVAGRSGIRPYLGVSTHLDVDKELTPLGGTKLLIGADYLFGGGVGFVWCAGLRIGTGQSAVMFEPLFELHYRWGSLYPLIPWLGFGFALRGSTEGDTTGGFNFSIGGRIVAGVEYFVSDSVAISAQFALPDLQARVLPTSAAVGNLEVIIGPHFRF
jgi:hypothetical protein